MVSPIRRTMLRGLAVVAAILGVGSPAVAAEYWVSTDGDDAADGSSSSPWATIQHAADFVAAGDTVRVLPGDYPEPVVSSAHGAEGARIVFRSEVSWGARIAADAYTAWQNSGDYVDIVGFDVTGTGQLGILNLGSYTRIVGNHVHDIPAQCGSNGGAGIDNGNYEAHDADIAGNVVHDIGLLGELCNSVHGIYHSNLRGHIWNNIAYRNVGWGIHTWHAPVDVVIANNLVFENENGGIIVGAGDSPGGVVADGFVVTNNIVLHNHGTGGIIEYGATGTNNVYKNNLLYGNDVGFTLENGNADEGTLDVDPLLMSYAADGTGDYHLQEASPCVDSGVEEGAPADDLEGVLRPQGRAWDLGPYEWHVPDAGRDGGLPPGDGGGASSGVTGSSSTSSASTGGAPADNAGPGDAGDVVGGCACSTQGARDAHGAWFVGFAAAIAIATIRRRNHEALRG